MSTLSVGSITGVSSISANDYTFSNSISVGNSSVNSTINATAMKVGGNTLTIGTGTYFVANGNVGIGTSSPQSALHITGAALSPATACGVHIGVQSGYATIEMLGTNATGSLIDFTSSNTDFNARIIHYNSNNHMHIQYAGGSRLHFGNTGCISVGDSSSTKGKFVVTGLVESSVATFYSGSNSVLSSISVGRTTREMTIGTAAVNAQFFSSVSTGDSVISYGTQKLFIGGGNIDVGGTLNAVFAANGNVGIDISNPSSRLHVSKEIAFTSPEYNLTMPMRKRFVQTFSQGANNFTYKIFTASRDPLNWSEYGPIEIIARNTYYQGGSYSRWIFTHGYSLNPSLVCVETGGVSGNIPNLYLGAEVTVNSNLRYTPVYCDVPYYRYFNFEINHNYTEVSSITGSTQIKFDNTYAANSSATMYGGNVYLAPSGGAVVVGNHPVLSGLSGTFYVGGGRQIAIDGGTNGAVYFRGDAGGWAMGMYAVGSSGTNRGGFGWLGGVDSVSYYWVGTAYNGTGVQLSYGGNSWATLSDVRDKNVYGNIQNALDKIKTITSIYYNYKTDEEGTPRRVGLIAQEVQAVYPEAITEIQRDIDNPTEETKRLSLSYTDMVPLLMQAIKELNEKFEEYKKTHP